MHPTSMTSRQAALSTHQGDQLTISALAELPPNCVHRRAVKVAGIIYSALEYRVK